MSLWLRWDQVIAVAATSLVVDTIKVGVALLRPVPGAMSRQALLSTGKLFEGRSAYF